MGKKKKRVHFIWKSITTLTLLATLASSVAPTAVSATEIITKETIEEVQAKDKVSVEQKSSNVENENSESTSQKNDKENQEATSESIHSETVENQIEEIEESSSSNVESSSTDFSESKESKQKIVEEKPAVNEESATTKSSVETFKADGNDVITKSEYVHYAAVITTADQPVFSEPGYTVGAKKIGETTTYRNQKIIILQEKVTGKGIWAQISINNKIIGWVAKDTLTVTYDKIIEQKMVHYDAIITQGRHDIYTVPGYTKGNILITKSSTYLNQKVRILQIIKTNRATWVQFSVNGTTVGWMNSVGLDIKYDTVKETKKVYYDAIVVEGSHDMYTVPGYTNGNEIITKSSTYLNETVQIIEEKVTDRATWALISQNGVTIGWMNKNGVKIAEYNDTVLESRSVHYEALISSRGQLIYSAPGYTKGSKVTANTKDYYKKNARILEEKVTNRATWALISVNNKITGWVDKAQLTIQYDSIKNTKTVHYDATVTQGRHDVYTVPGYTEGNKIITKSSSYLNKKARIIKTIETNRATWAQFSIDGKTIGWMNINGLSIQYDKIISSNKVDIIARVAEGRHDIYTIPGYTKNNELITKSETYLNQEITIVEEKKTRKQAEQHGR